MAPCPQCNKQLEAGTLSQLRNFINMRNVVTKVARDCHVLSDFVDLVTDCHVLATAMKHLGMMTEDSRLSSLPRLIHLWSADRKNTLDCKLLEPSSVVCISVYI